MTTVLTTTTTTTSKRRDPLTTINMATTQARPTPSTGGGTSSSGGSKARGGRRANDLDENANANKLAERKRKPGYDEDVEGFQFSRLPAKKTRSVEPAESAPVPVPVPVASPTGRKDRKGRPSEAERSSTARKSRPSRSKTDRNGFVSPEPAPAPETKITLPMADTPVMQRNKDMRTAAKSEKGSRRSSLGMRGRRASSLIDSGASNALPHKEVGTADFYKHISPDLPEPRRMRQLLIWCATRAIGNKPSGSSRSEDHSARLAARVIQEELLKDFESNSELSNWFGREDEAPPAVVVKKPHPKNVQNTEKIRELEEQIQRLQKERQSLNALLRPPSVPRIKPKAKPDTSSSTTPSQIDPSHLDPSQQQILSLLRPQSQSQSQSQPQPPAPPTTTTPTEPLPPITPAAVSSRLSRLTASLGPTLDTLASGVHDIELYRAMSDRVSARVLRICAERLDERDARNAAHWLGVEGEDNDTATTRPREKPREDLGLILGALSRVERR